MDVWIKSLVDVVITDEISMVALKLCLLMVIGIMPLCLGGIFKVDFTTAMLCCCSQFLVYVKNKPSLWMNSY